MMYPVRMKSMAKPDRMPMRSETMNRNSVVDEVGMMSTPNTGDNSARGILKKISPGTHLPIVSEMYCPKTLRGRKNLEEAVPSQKVTDAVVWTSTCCHRIAATRV